MTEAKDTTDQQEGNDALPPDADLDSISLDGDLADSVSVRPRRNAIGTDYHGKFDEGSGAIPWQQLNRGPDGAEIEEPTEQKDIEHAPSHLQRQMQTNAPSVAGLQRDIHATKEAFESTDRPKSDKKLNAELQNTYHWLGRFGSWILLALVLFVVTWLVIDASEDPPKAATDALLPAREMLQRDRQCIATLSKFLEADDVQAMLPLVTNPVQVRPLMESYYQQHEIPDASLKDSIHIVADRSHWIHSELPASCILAYVKDPIGIISNYILVQDDSRNYAIDWESSVGYNQLNVEEWVEKKDAQQVTLRVTASRSDYYNYHFNEDHYWALSLEVEGADFRKLPAFVDRQSSAYATLRTLFTTPDRQQYALLVSVSFPGNIDEPIVEIKTVEQPHWFDANHVTHKRLVSE